MPIVIIDEDNYGLVVLGKVILGIPEQEVVNVYFEIGLINILNYPTGNERIDKVLSTGKYPELVEHIKSIWNLPKK